LERAETNLVDVVRAQRDVLTLPCKGWEIGWLLGSLDASEQANAEESSDSTVPVHGTTS
jgi:hypothetical protein